MDELKIQVDSDNITKSAKNPKNQGKILVFDIIKKSKPIPFEAHISVERIVKSVADKKSQPIGSENNVSSVKTADFIKIQKNAEFIAQTENKNASDTDKDKHQESFKKDSFSKYKITGQKTLRIRNFLITFRFALLALLIILIAPFGAKVNQTFQTKQFVKNQSLQALSDVALASSSIGNKDFKDASFSFAKALEKFALAQKSIENLGDSTLFLLASLPGVSGQLAQGEKLIQIAKNITEMGQIFSLILEKITSINQQQITFSSITPSLGKFSLLFNETDALIKEIDFSTLPSPLNQYQDKIKEIISPFGYLSDFLKDFLPLLKEVLGVDNFRQYLIIFQNPSEIRPTGGFIGSYALVTIDDGIIKKFKIDDVYNIDGQLKVAVIPPNPIQKVSAAWSFHDANWFFDFPTSAKKLQWFYEKTGGATTDGVIAVTPKILGALLKITGPIYLEKYNTLLNETNFIDVLQYEVEVDYNKDLGQPKTILSDLGEHLIKRFSSFNVNDIAKFLSEILDLIDKKEIMFYFNNPDLEQFVIKQGWSGQIPDFDGDYLAIVNTNLNGYKTDKVIEQSANIFINIAKDGTTKNTVELLRKHNGGDSIFDWYNKVNTNFLRFYVPQESQLLKAKGHTIEVVPPKIDYVKAKFKTDPDVVFYESNTKMHESGFSIFPEKNKKVFGAWTYVSPKEELKVSIEYLSVKLDLNKPRYQIYLQKQPGMQNQKVNIYISYPENWKVVWNFPDDLQLKQGLITYSTNLEYDEIISLNFENNG